MSIYNQLISDGYYIGSSYDILSEEELEFCYSNMSKSLDLGYEQKHEEFDEYLWYYTYNGGLSNKVPKKYKNTYFIPYNKLDEYKEIRKLYNCADPKQQWFFSNFQSLLGDSFFEQVNHKIIKFVESIYNMEYELVLPQLSLTYYSPGDYIDIHRDGMNPGRVCGILIYLCSKEEYDISYGGRFFIEPNNKKQFYNPKDIYTLSNCIDPVRPNYILLDFTKNDCYHAVEEVKEKFGRHAIFGFLYNKNYKPKIVDHI